jgi:Na+/melibiose symporter-like transporter
MIHDMYHAHAQSRWTTSRRTLTGIRHAAATIACWLLAAVAVMVAAVLGQRLDSFGEDDE